MTGQQLPRVVCLCGPARFAADKAAAAEAELAAGRVVVTTPDIEAELIAFCRQRLTHYKCPTSVEERESLPRPDHRQRPGGG